MLVFVSNTLNMFNVLHIMKLRTTLFINMMLVDLLKPFNICGSEINLMPKNCDVDDHGDMLRIIN